MKIFSFFPFLFLFSLNSFPFSISQETQTQTQTQTQELSSLHKGEVQDYPYPLQQGIVQTVPHILMNEEVLSLSLSPSLSPSPSSSSSIVPLHIAELTPLDELDQEMKAILQMEETLLKQTNLTEVNGFLSQWHLSKQTISMLTIVPPLLYLTHTCFEKTYLALPHEQETSGFISCMMYHFIKLIMLRK